MTDWYRLLGRAFPEVPEGSEWVEVGGEIVGDAAGGTLMALRTPAGQYVAYMSCAAFEKMKADANKTEVFVKKKPPAPAPKGRKNQWPSSRS